jgi:hypothetical protein
MPLTADQQAMLQLLLERGQSYSDLASLLGIEEPEVRSRARAALAELGGDDPDRNVGLADYLLGQADPIGRADAARHLREHSGDRRLAAVLAERLGEIAPGAKLPSLPGERPGRPRAAPKPAPERRLPALSGSQPRLLVALGSAAVLLVAVILGVTGAFGGDDGSDGETTTTTTDDGGTQVGENLARVRLRAAGGGDAQGEATIGLATADTPFLDLTIRNLEPAPGGRSYFLWFMLGETEGYPFVPVQLQRSGRFDDRFAIPSEYIPVVQGATAIDIWLSPNQELGRNIQDAIRDVSFVKVPGDLVLHGPLDRQASGEQSG